jgi:hypothetical protein
VWAFASAPDLNDETDALMFGLAVVSAHVALGYALREWTTLLLAFAPVILEPFFENAMWAPLVLLAYGVPAAALMALGTGTAKFQAFRRRGASAARRAMR